MNIRESMEQREQNDAQSLCCFESLFQEAESGRRKNAMYGLSIRETGTGSS